MGRLIFFWIMDCRCAHRAMNHRQPLLRILAVAIVFGTAFLSGAAAQAERKVFGYLENVLIYPGAFPMQAKLDTGADHSSIDARFVTIEKRNGSSWVTFELVNKAGLRRRFELQVTRQAKVKRHSGNVHVRPVVRMELCLGDIKRVVDVNLVNRKALSYRMLIGRSFLAGQAVVDSAARYTMEPACQ